MLVFNLVLYGYTNLWSIKFGIKFLYLYICLNVTGYIFSTCVQTLIHLIICSIKIQIHIFKNCITLMYFFTNPSSVLCFLNNPSHTYLQFTIVLFYLVRVHIMLYSIYLFIFCLYVSTGSHTCCALEIISA